MTNWNQILNFGSEYGLPMAKKKAILREYLQTKILDLIYQEKDSAGMVFVGGTSLRLTRGIDRFSEDLDFDLVGSKYEGVDRLMSRVADKFSLENIAVDFYRNQTESRIYHELRFTGLVFQLGLGGQKGEKLTIKFDYEQFWRGHDKNVVLINRYGFLVKCVTIPMDQHLVQKLTAYLRRKQTLARDIYDILWLIAQGAKIDQDFLEANEVEENLVEKAVDKFNREKSKLATYQSRLKPFLINEDYIDKLDLFPDLVGGLNLFS
jgi:predicted nucleotidyltransferase component of viral defense system